MTDAKFANIVFRILTDAQAKRIRTLVETASAEGFFISNDEIAGLIRMAIIERIMESQSVEFRKYLLYSTELVDWVEVARILRGDEASNRADTGVQL